MCVACVALCPCMGGVCVMPQWVGGAWRVDNGTKVAWFPHDKWMDACFWLYRNLIPPRSTS